MDEAHSNTDGKGDNEAPCSIYKITNQKNGKIYIGQTWKSIAFRFRLHTNASKGNGKGSCTKLCHALRKYGHDSFTIETIATTQTQVDADYLEDKYIVLFDSIENGYNIRSGGSRGKHSPETRAKLSKALTGKARPAELRARISAALTGRKLGPRSQETREKIAAKHRGRKSTDEQRAAISEVHCGKKLSASHRDRMSEAHRLKWAAMSLEERQLLIQRLESSRRKRKQAWLDSLEKGLDPVPVSKAEKILTAIKRCPQLCLGHLAEDIYGENSAVTRQRLNSSLNDLRKRMVVERTGDSQSYQWRILWERFMR